MNELQSIESALSRIAIALEELDRSVDRISDYLERLTGPDGHGDRLVLHTYARTSSVEDAHARWRSRNGK